MASFDGKKDGRVGNGRSLAETLSQVGLSFLAGILPLISARLVGWLGRKSSPQPLTTLPPIPSETPGEKHDGPPDLPPLEELP